MKLSLLLLCISMCLLCLFGCTPSFNNDIESILKDEIVNDLNINSTASDYTFMLIHADYREYNNADDLIDAATNIYTGIVNDISYEIIDYVTGNADTSSKSQSSYRMLYTVYTISLTKSIKGNNPDEIKICIMGGIIGYKETEQYCKMETSGLLNEYQSIPIINKSATLNIGNEYMFCTSRTVGEYDFAINPTQFVHRIDSHNTTLITRLCEAELSAEKQVGD